MCIYYRIFEKQMKPYILTFLLLCSSMLEAKPKIIIGIHGLANKAPKAELAGSWQKSIEEGLAKNEQAPRDISFELVYWADFIYKYPNHSDTNMCYDDSFTPEMYYPARDEDLEEYESGIFEDLATGAADIAVNTAGTIGSGINNLIYSDSTANNTGNLPFFKEIGYYFNQYQTITDKHGNRINTRYHLRNFLKATLMKYKDYEIMLIAHSMGSLISYDLLLDIEDVNISHFITIGSPLGLEYFRKKVAYRHKMKMDSLCVPECVGAWSNFMDIRDLVCAFDPIDDEYAPNSNDIEIKNYKVNNNYYYFDFNPINGQRESEPSYNRHKSFGYLRTPEISKVISEFLKD